MNIIMKDSRENIDKYLRYREFNGVTAVYIDTTTGVPMRIIKLQDGSELAFPIVDRIFIEG